MEKSTLNSLLTIVLNDSTKTEDEITLLTNSLIEEGASINDLPFSSVIKACGSAYYNEEKFADKMLYLIRLIRAGIDANSKDEDGMTALMWATLSGSLELVNLLLEAGANPNLTTNNLFTAIMGCARLQIDDNSRECFVALMKAGADIDATNNKGETLASLVKDRQCCSCYVGNCRNSDGRGSFMTFLMMGLEK